ncbi:MAG: GMC family oxidoreductase [Burkholderiales bacterium]
MDSADNGYPQLDFDAARLPAAALEHRQLVAAFRRLLLRVGYWNGAKAIPLSGSAHACGTAVMGNDARRAVGDANGKVFGMENLYIVDGSVLPRSSRVNPALTIYAWALRVASRLETRESLNENDFSENDRIRVNTVRA